MARFSKTAPVRQAVARQLSPAGMRTPWNADHSVLLRAALIALAAIIAFWPALRGGPVLDDAWYIFENPLMKDPGGLAKFWFAPGSWIEFYPLQETVLWLEYQLWGDDTLGYHVVNLALHIANALLLWRLLAKFGLRAAWIGGLIFAVHPAVVDTVANMTELKNTLSLAPFLGAMMAWIDFEERGEKRDYLMALGLFLVAMLCKISMAPFPLIILLYAWWKRGRVSWLDVKRSLPFWLIALELVYTSLLVSGLYERMPGNGEEAVDVGGFLPRVANGGLILAYYFGRVLLPIGLTPEVPRWQANPASPWPYLPWVVLAAFAGGAWTRRTTWGRHALLGVGFFLLNIAPFLGFHSVSYMNVTWVWDHLLYLPIVGLIGLATAAISSAEVRLPVAARQAGAVLVGAIVCLFTLESFTYAGVFRDAATLWGYAIARNPGAWNAHYSLAYELVRQGRLDEGAAEYQRAIDLGPQRGPLYVDLGAVYLKAGRVNDAIRILARGVEVDPGAIQARYNLGHALVQAQRLPEAVEQFAAAVKIDPTFAEGHVSLGVALAQSGRLPEAISEFQAAIRLAPDSEATRLNLANAFLATHRVPEAIEQYEAVLGFDPDNTAVRDKLALLRQ